MNLTVELVNGILQYLGSRPYVEVASLINGIQTEAASQVAEAVPVETPVEVPTES